MKKITLDDVINEQLIDPEFAACYDKELLINAIAVMVTELRTHAELTQAELAERAGTSQPVIARLESGIDSRVPTLELLSRIATASNARLTLQFEVRD